MELTQPCTCKVLTLFSNGEDAGRYLKIIPEKKNWLGEKRPFLHLAAAVLVTSPNVKS